MIITISDKEPASELIAVSDIVIITGTDMATVRKDRHGKVFGRSVPIGELDEFVIKYLESLT